MRKLSNNPIDLKVKYGKQAPIIAGWYYEEPSGIEIFSDIENVERKNNYVGTIGKRKLLGIVSRIYGIDFKKYLKKRKEK